MSRFYTVGCIFFTFINFCSILLLYHHYQHYIIIVPKSTSGSATPKHKPVTVDTGNGSYEGFIQKFDNKNVNTFLGIPFAEPPTGSLRFKAPVPLNLSGQKLRTDQWSSPCLQPDNHLQLNNHNFSEDCLYLNVWSPATSDKKLLPVLVIIHTGAFLFGSASEVTYNGLALAQMSKTVVVTFNYRLNLLGFYYDPENPEIVPNAGMLDQVLALRWINENIAHFGGNPERVILIGQSSAGLAAGMHLTSPLSRNLFSDALIMSGSPLQAGTLNSRDQVKQFWNNYEMLMNCSTVPRAQKPSCLVDKVIQDRNANLIKMENVKLFSEDKLFVNAPIVADGSFQPRSQLELLDSLESYKNPENLVLLFGYTDDEGSWIASIDNKDRFGPKARPNFSDPEARAELQGLVKKMRPSKEVTGNGLENHYLGTLLESQPGDKNGHLLGRLVSEVLGDHYINCPANIFAQKMMEKNAKVYQYYWNYKGDPKTSAFWSTFSNVWCGEWMGSCHSFEMFALFGQPFLEPGNFNDDDRIVSRKLIDMVTYFAHNRKLFWPEFSPESKPYYVIDAALSKHQFGQNLKEKECSKIWYDYIV